MHSMERSTTRVRAGRRMAARTWMPSIRRTGGQSIGVFGKRGVVVSADDDDVRDRGSVCECVNRCVSWPGSQSSTWQPTRVGAGGSGDRALAPALAGCVLRVDPRIRGCWGAGGDRIRRPRRIGRAREGCRVPRRQRSRAIAPPHGDALASCSSSASIRSLRPISISWVRKHSAIVQLRCTVSERQARQPLAVLGSPCGAGGARFDVGGSQKMNIRVSRASSSRKTVRHAQRGGGS